VADNFRSLANHFKREFPHVRLSICRKKWKGDYADCWPTTDGWMCIWVQRDLEEGFQLLLLAHEMGHALTFFEDSHPSDHGPLFGQGYSAAWRSYLRWVESS
jgi:hypothetical protein